MYFKQFSTLFFFIFTILFSSCEKSIILLSGEKPTIELKNNQAHVNGVLGKTFYKRFRKFIEENPIVKDVVLEDVPGSANDEWNVKSCLLLQKKGMNTIVKSNSEIASGGVDLFISGNKRTIEQGAMIGVHSWSDMRKDGSEYPRDSEEHDIFIDFFNEIEMDTAFYWYTLRAAPANSIHWMTEDEIEFYGLRN